MSEKPSRLSPFIAREVVVTHHGHRVTVSHKPSDYPWQGLGCQLIDTLMNRAIADDLAKDTLRMYTKVIRDFCVFMGQRDGVSPHGLEASGDGISEGVYAWSNHLRRHHTRQSKVPNRYLSALCLLIRDYAGAGHEVGSTTLARANAGSLIPRGRDGENALPPFSNRERLLIRDAARQQVRQLESRLSLGASLLDDAPHPVHEKFPAVRSMLKALMSGSELPFGESSLAAILWPPETLELGYKDKTSVRRTALRRLSSLLGPLRGELQGLRILLMQASGWAPEEIHDLLISETTELSTGRVYTRRKARAGYIKEQHIPNGKSGQWDFNALIDRLLRVTTTLRLLANEPTRDWYFLTVSGESGVPVVGVASFHSVQSTFSSWVTQNGLDLTEPFDIRRVRKTVRTIKTMQAATLEDAAGDEHTTSTYIRHYVPSSTTKILSAHILRTAQNEVLSSVRDAGPTLVASAAREAAGASDLPAAIIAAASKEDVASDVDKALLPVTCRDEFDSPFGEKGGICPTMAALCMVCPNAFIFEDHIPRIAAYEKILDRYQLELAPSEFLDRYGHAKANVTNVMAAMDPQIVAKARTNADTGLLKLPISMKVSLT